MTLVSTTDEQYNKIIAECLPHYENLRLITMSTGTDKPEGNIYYKDGSYIQEAENIPVQKNLISLARISRRIIEIGFNMGHSCLLMLLTNPDCKIDCIDICEHSYTEYCFQYIALKFPGRVRLFKGSSHNLISYADPLVDFIHIDGCHDERVANIDFFISKSKARNDGYIVFDDTWLETLSKLWAGYVKDGHVKPIELIPTTRHSIGQNTMPKWKITVATLASGEQYKHIVRYGHLGKKLYCRRYHYNFCDDESVIDKTRPIAWSKVKLIQKCLQEDVDYVVWMDADTHIMNPELRLENFITRLSDGRDILLASDTKMINSGVMFIKNTEWSRNFFEVLYQQTDFLYHSNWEQAGIIHMYDTNMLDSHQHMKVLPASLQHEFNSYYFMYKYGHFLIHVAGCYRDDKNNGLDLMMDRYCPIRMEHDTDDSFKERIERICKGETFK